MSEEIPTAKWLLSMAQDIENSDGVATVMKRGDSSVKKIKPEYYGDMIISTPLTAADLIWALRRAAETLEETTDLPDLPQEATDTEIRRVVKALLFDDNRLNDYPIYEREDDRGLDEAEYINFATDVIRALRTSTLSRPQSGITSAPDASTPAQRLRE